MKCSKENCDQHSTFYRTITNSPQWSEWYREQRKRFKKFCEDNKSEEPMFDTDESQEIGRISQRHFQEFLKWIKENDL